MRPLMIAICSYAFGLAFQSAVFPGSNPHQHQQLIVRWRSEDEEMDLSDIEDEGAHRRSAHRTTCSTCSATYDVLDATAATSTLAATAL